MRRSLRLVGIVLAACTGWTSVQGALVSPETALRQGLVRAWFAQVGAPRVSGNLTNVTLDHGMLLCQSSRGKLTALDAETGRTLWSTQIGSPHSANSEAAANAEFVVVVNGSVLVVLDRDNGAILWQRSVSGAPGAGPGVTATHAFVPMLSGLVEGYDLAKGAKQTPWNYKSSGRVLVAPIATARSVGWTTERGYFYVASPTASGIRYRLETRDAIQSRPAHWSPLVFAGSSDGYVYAVDENKGEIRWKYSIGDAIYETPAPIDDKLFVVADTAGMFCLDSATGSLLWRMPGIKQFVSASPGKVYASDRVGRLSAYDLHSGVQRGGMSLTGITKKIMNTQSDRIYLVDDRCVVQCLREAQLRKPVVYAPPAPVEEEEVKLKPRRPAAEKGEEAFEEPADEMPTDEMPEEGEAEDGASPFDTEP